MLTRCTAGSTSGPRAACGSACGASWTTRPIRADASRHGSYFRLSGRIEDEVFEFAKDIIGIDDWDQVIYKAPIPMRPELND